MPLLLEGPPELSGTNAILLVFQVDYQHERITDVYVGLQGRFPPVYSRPNPDFVKDIEGDLKAAHGALKAGATPVRGVPFASLSATMEAPCPSPRIHCTASSTQQAM